MHANHRSVLAFSLLVLSLLAGCTTYDEQILLGSDDYEIATRIADDGVTETWSLENGRYLRVQTTRHRSRAFLGLKVVELDKAHAEARGVRPYSGLLVEGTYPDSAARRAGVLAGDVLLRVGEREVVYLEQLARAESTLRIDEPVVCQLLRGDQPIELELVARELEETVTDRQDIVLEAAPAVSRPYAGVTLRGIPSVWCERIFGGIQNAAVISEVAVGSPAWLGGFRAGDILIEVDGEPVPPVAELAKRIRAAGPAGRTMTWKVQREEGSVYEGKVALADYSGTTRVHIPLLWSSKNSAREDRWSIGWGLIMGNRNRYIEDQSTRRAKTRNVFSALLGLIRVESDPDDTHVRLLWVISFDT